MKTRMIGNILWSPLARSMCFVLLISTFTSGCAVPISSNNYESQVKKDEFYILVGESQERVIRKLGSPDNWMIQGTRQFMIYSSSTSQVTVVGIYLFVPMASKDTKRVKHCYRIEIGKNNIVKDYKIDSQARYSGASYPLNSPFSCQSILTNDWELPDLEIRTMRNISAQLVYPGFLETPYRAVTNGEVTNDGSVDSRDQFRKGDLISMTTNKEITIASTKVTSLKIVVTESDNTKITGRLSGFLGYVDEAMENEIGSIIEIMRSDIEYVWVEEIRL